MNINFEQLKDYADQVGDSFYLFDRDDFTQNFKSLLNHFRAVYSNTQIAYSYKTNYLPAICRQVDTLGGYAEVVSDMEFQLAKKIGVASNRIFYNGPIKKKETVEQVCLGGGITNIDSLHDLVQLEEIAALKSACIFNIGIRCNFDIDDGVVSRFGFDIDDSSFIDCLNRIGACANIQVQGFQCHFASRSRRAWENAARGMIKILDVFEAKGGDLDSLTFVSLGGGLYGPLADSLKMQLDPHAPNFEDYAEAAARPLAEYFCSRGSSRPTLFLEPGTAVVANCIKYVCEVKGIKRVANKNIAHVAGSSFNINGNARGINLPISVYSRNSEGDHYECIDFAGYTCVESDYLYRGYVGTVQVGDFIVLDSAGSYSIVMKPPFIFPNVPIIEPNEGSFRFIKRQEDFDDIFKTYSFEE